MERRFMLLIPNMLKSKCHKLEVMYVCCNYVTGHKGHNWHMCDKGIRPASIRYVFIQEDALTEDHTNSSLHRFKVSLTALPLKVIFVVVHNYTPFHMYLYTRFCQHIRTCNVLCMYIIIFIQKPGSKNYQNIFPPSATLHLSNIP